jgi:hypothetical protein
MNQFPCLVRSVSPAGEPRYALGDPLVDRYLEFVAGRCRPNTVRAVTFDLKAFFTVVDRDPVTVEPPHVFEFLAQQRVGRSWRHAGAGESGAARSADSPDGRSSPDGAVGAGAPDVAEDPRSGRG